MDFVGKRSGKRMARARECALKEPERASRTPRGLFVISRSGVQVRPPAPALPWGTSEYGGVPEWPKGTDCKSAGYAYGGSNPPAPTKTALISSKSGLFCNFSGHFAFQGLDEGQREKERRSCSFYSKRLGAPDISQPVKTGSDPFLTHTGKT